MIGARLRELAQYVGAGPWRARRSEFDGSLILYDDDGTPLALVYGGTDLARYLELCSPAALLGDDEVQP